MTLAQRMKKGLTKMVPASVVTYKAEASKPRKTIKVEGRKAPQRSTMKQYGDKGYNPVSKSVTKKK